MTVTIHLSETSRPWNFPCSARSSLWQRQSGGKVELLGNEEGQVIGSGLS